MMLKCSHYLTQSLLCIWGGLAGMQIRQYLLPLFETLEVFGGSQVWLLVSVIWYN